jgi:hypothetical protein
MAEGVSAKYQKSAMYFKCLKIYLEATHKVTHDRISVRFKFPANKEKYREILGSKRRGTAKQKMRKSQLLAISNGSIVSTSAISPGPQICT